MFQSAEKMTAALGVRERKIHYAVDTVPQFITIINKFKYCSTFTDFSNSFKTMKPLEVFLESAIYLSYTIFRRSHEKVKAGVLILSELLFHFLL